MKGDEIATFRPLPGWQIAIDVTFSIFDAMVLLILIFPDVPFVHAPCRFAHPMLRPIFAVPIMMLIWLAMFLWFKTSYTIRVHPDGVSLYGLWWLPWENIHSAKYVKLLGFTSLQVNRHKGVPWEISLYVFPPGLAETIIEASPPDNPLRLLAPPER